MERIYGLYKRIMKRDSKAIDEIKDLDEAKAIIKMMAENAFLNGQVYELTDDFKKNR